MKAERNLAAAAPAVTLGLLALYASILPQQLSMANQGADGGDFMAAILCGGVPHPTGYPVYLLAGRLMQSLPTGTPYARQVAFSALCAALAAGLLTACFGLFYRGRKPSVTLVGALVCGAALGTAPLVWAQAEIVDVHALQLLFSVCLLLWLTLLAEGEPADRTTSLLLWLLCIPVGLSLGNHLTILLAFPLLPYAFWLAWRRGMKPVRLAAYAALVLLLGLGVYAYIPYLAAQNPPVNWENAHDLAGLLRLVSGRQYQGLLFGAGLSEVLQRIGAWAQLLLKQSGIIGLYFGVSGLFFLQGSGRPHKWMLLWVFCIYSIFSIGYRTNDSTAYLLPAWMAFSVWAGVGAADTWENAGSGFAWGRLLVGLFAVLLLVQTALNRSQLDPRRDLQAQLFADRCMASLPEDAIVLTGGDEDTFTLWYTQYGLLQREDVRIVSLGLLQYDWYRQNLAHTYPGLHLPPGDDYGEAEMRRANAGISVCRADYESAACVCSP